MRSLLFGLLALLPSVSMAGATYGSTNSVPAVSPALMIGTEQLLPHRGGYWDPSAPGSGYFVDVSRRSDNSVFGFATAYTYDAEGRSTFLILSGTVTFASETQRQNEGWYAKLVSPSYQAAGGQPFGGAYRPANVTPSTYGEGELIWKTRRSAELRVGGRVTQIRTLHPDDAVTEATNLLAGEWTVQVRQRNASSPAFPLIPISQQYHSQIVRLTPVSPNPVWSLGVGANNLTPAVLATMWLPTPNVITFDVVCVSDCVPTTLPYPNGVSPRSMVYSGARVWIDPVTLRAGWVRNAVAETSQAMAPNLTQHPGFGLTTYSYDLYVDDDTAVGRGNLIISDPSNLNFAPGLFPGSELVMTRVTPNALHAPQGQEVKIF